MICRGSAHRRTLQPMAGPGSLDVFWDDHRLLAPRIQSSAKTSGCSNHERRVNHLKSWGYLHQAYLLSEDGKQLTCSIRITEMKDPDSMQLLRRRDCAVCGGGRYRGDSLGCGVSWSWPSLTTNRPRVHQESCA